MKPGKHALFLQVTEPGFYPPLVNVITQLVARDWRVSILSAPIAGGVVQLPDSLKVQRWQIAERPSHVVSKSSFLRYGLKALRLAWRLRPALIYASDPSAALFGVLASRLTGAALIYHEHDSPTHLTHLNRLFRKGRELALRRARFVVFPNAERGRRSLAAYGMTTERLRVIWNLPRRAEIPAREALPQRQLPLVLYYHGGISPERLPKNIAVALRALGGAVVLDIVGFETPGARGYVAEFLAAANADHRTALATYHGEHAERASILTIAARADIGLALMPMHTSDLNMAAMVGASNKAFDYMAAGLALLVSELPDWNETFVRPGYGWACNPDDPASVINALQFALDHRPVLETIAVRNRARIETQWNYDSAFAPLLAEIEALPQC